MFNLNKMMKDALGFTQAGFVGSFAGNLDVAGATRAHNFTRSSMASLTGDFLITIGDGSFEPTKHARFISQYANDQQVSVLEVITSYNLLLASLGHEPNLLRTIVAGIMGHSDRPLSQRNVPAVTPTMIFEHVKNTLPSKTTAIFHHLITDYLASRMAKLGWLVKDAPYTYRLRKTRIFPGFRQLVDVIATAELRRSLEALDRADISILTKARDSKQAIRPLMIATHLASAISVAWESSRGAYDSEEVVVSVLSVLGRLWSPSTPAALVPAERIQTSQVVSELRSDLSMYLATQDMIFREKVTMDVHFSDEEMINVILPLFYTSMKELSPYKTWMLGDVTSFFTKRTVRNHEQAPAHVAIYENWKYDNSVTAFTPVRHSPQGAQKFLLVDDKASSALANAMSGVRSVINTQEIVDARMNSYEMLTPSTRNVGKSTEVILGLPSIGARESDFDLPTSALRAAITAGKLDNTITDQAEIPQTLFDAQSYDYYCMITHLAVARSSHVSIVATSDNEKSAGNGTHLMWLQTTDLRTPIGASAITNGEVYTTEPIEALVYMDDFTASDTMSYDELNLVESEYALHLWQWNEASVELNLEPTYDVKVGGKSYSAMINEHEVLGIGLRRTNVWYLRPSLAKAVARMWVEYAFEEDKFVQGALKKAKDPLVIATLRGRQMQSSLGLARAAMSIGATGTGSNTRRYVEQRLAAAMHGAGHIDDYVELHAGVQRHRLNVWSGLVTLRVLDLIDPQDVTMIINNLRTHNALSLLVGESPA